MVKVFPRRLDLRFAELGMASSWQVCHCESGNTYEMEVGKVMSHAWSRNVSFFPKNKVKGMITDSAERQEESRRAEMRFHQRNSCRERGMSWSCAVTSQ